MAPLGRCLSIFSRGRVVVGHGVGASARPDAPRRAREMPHTYAGHETEKGCRAGFDKSSAHARRHCQGQCVKPRAGILSRGEQSEQRCAGLRTRASFQLSLERIFLAQVGRSEICITPYERWDGGRWDREGTSQERSKAPALETSINFDSDPGQRRTARRSSGPPIESARQHKILVHYDARGSGDIETRD
jgi:hypothetical protein